MSFSFNYVADDKAKAVSQLETEMDKVASEQPIHARDRNAVVEGGKAFINVLEQQPNTRIVVAANGSLGTTAPAEGSDHRPTTSAQFGISAYLEAVTPA